MPILTESKTKFWGEGSETILDWATDGDEGVFFERIFGIADEDFSEEELEIMSDSYRLGEMCCQANKEKDGSVILFMNTIRTIPVGAFEKIASLFPNIHAEGIFIHQTEEFFGSYIIEKGQFLWTQFHNPGKRSSQDGFYFNSFFEDVFSKIEDEKQRAILKVLELDRRILRGDSSAASEMEKMLKLFRDEKKQEASIDFYFSSLEKKALCGDCDSQYELYESIDSQDYYEDKHIYDEDNETESDVFYNDWDLMKNSWLHKAAMNGHPDAQYEMAEYCAFRTSWPDKDAMEWVKKSIINGCEAALAWPEIFLDATCDDNSPIIGKDFLDFLEGYAEQKTSVEQMKNLAWYYQNANKEEKAQYWLNRAVELGDLSALVDLASDYLRKGNEKEAIEKYEKAVDQGSVEAMLSLAKIYASKKDNTFVGRAVKLYEQAGENDSSYAFSELAKMYAFGDVVEKDIKKSLQYLSKSYSLDNYGAAFTYLFVCLEDGLLDSEKLKISKSKLIRIINEENAANEIAKIYNGEDEMACALGIKKNECKYVDWLKKAVQNEDLCSMYKLGKIYYEGKLVKRNYKNAYELFIRHSIGGVAEDIEDRSEFSEYFLGLMYKNGNYIPQNLFMAEKWLVKPAEVGDKDSIDELNNVRLQIKEQKLERSIKSVIEAESFDKAVAFMTEEMFRSSLDEFRKVRASYCDTQERLKKCLKELDMPISGWNAQNKKTYEKALSYLEGEKYSEAKNLFTKILGWEDSAKKLEEVDGLASNNEYEKAIKLIEEGNLKLAEKKLQSIKGWRDSEEILKNLPKFGYEKLICQSDEFIEGKKYKKALNVLVIIQGIGYKSKDIDKINKDICYCKAFLDVERQDFKKASEQFEKLCDWRDSKEQLSYIDEIDKDWKYDRALYLIDNKKYNEAKEILLEIADWKDSKNLIRKCDLSITVCEN